MSGSDREGSVTVTTDGVAVEKRASDEFPVPAVAFDVRSERSETVVVELVERVPREVAAEELGFHPEYGDGNWAVGQNHVTFRRVLEPNAECTTVYAVGSTDRDLDSFLTEPRLETHAPRKVASTDGVTVVKRLVEGDPEMPAIAFDVTSERSERVAVTFVDRISGLVSADDLVFHSDYGPEYWAMGTDRVTFRREFDPGSEFTTVYGIDAPDGNAVSQFLTDHVIGEVDPPRRADARSGDAASEGRAPRARGVENRVPADVPEPPQDLSFDYVDLDVGETVGTGGSADVSRATLSTRSGDVTVAVKVPQTDGTLHGDQVERLLQEAETWDRLDDHDHVVGILDYGSAPVPWIAMEYMDGGHLGERAGEMDTPETLWTAIAVTKGVRHAHRRGVAHLDLKPENVLFRTVEDAWDVPKVADWGLAERLLDRSESADGFSPQYAAPEQFDDDHGPTDDLTDVYQLGAVCYELFTGRPPFEGDTAQVARRALSEDPRPPSEVADVPEALDDVLLTALATEREDRYESVLLLRNALQELFDAY